MSAPRVPAGTTSGGRWAAHARTEADSCLPALVYLSARRDKQRLDEALDRCSNLFGPISKTSRQLILDFVDQPSEETWADAHGVLITPETTLWQAVLEHTDYGVDAGPRSEVTDPGFPPFRPAVVEAVEPWRGVPRPSQVRTAIAAATQ